MRAQLSKALLSTLHYPVGGTKCCVNPNLILELVAGQLWPTMVNSGQLWSPFLPVSLDFQLCCYKEFLPRTFLPVLVITFSGFGDSKTVPACYCSTLFSSLYHVLKVAASKQVLLELKVLSDLGQRGIDGSGHGMRATQKIWLQVWRVVHIGQQGLVTHCQKQCQMNHVITRRLKLAF